MPRTFKRPNYSPYFFNDVVFEGLDYINKHSDNQRIFGCFNKNRYDKLESFGVYNAATKKYSIHYINTFYPEDLEDLKRVVEGR